MDSYVVKVQYNGATRRFLLGEFSFQKLQTRLRDAFQFPSTVLFQLTYVDKDQDVITLIGDEDLEDALAFQKLNPLRVKIESLQTGSGGETSLPVNGAKSVEGEESVTTAEPVINSGENTTVPEETIAAVDEGTLEPSSVSATPTPETVHDAMEKTSIEGATGEKSIGADMEVRENDPDEIHHGIACDGCETNPITGPRFKSTVRPDYDLCGKCYAASDAEENEYVKLDRLFFRIGYGPGYLGRISRRHGQGMCGRPDRRPNSNHNTANEETQSGEKKQSGDTLNKIVHIGVHCDECGVVPIEGPRFQSIVRFNYDLCQNCFQKSGSNTSEYSRIDEPVVLRDYPMQVGHLLRRGSPWVPLPSECPFFGHQVWISNDMVSKPDLEQAGAEGKGTKEEGTVDLPTAGPDVVGTPVIFNDAVDSGKDFTVEPESPAGLEKLPTENGTAEGDNSSPTSRAEGTERKAKVVDNANSTVGAEGASQGAVVVDDSLQTAGVQETVQTPADKFYQKSGVEETVQPQEDNASQKLDVKQTVQSRAAEGGVSTLESKLAKLATIGFEDAKLNEELLEKNNFDLRKTLDDLCAAEEWDPILGDLQEMGFYDENLNRRLMFKNNGSVKRVVKELVQMNKGETKA